MQAGKLNHFVAIERLELIPDGGGGFSEEWRLKCKVWAQVLTLTGREYFAAQQVQSEADIRVRMRYRDDVTPLDRISHGGKILEIVHVADPDGRRRKLELLCKG